MADNIGTATVKITGDVTPLQQAIDKAEVMVEQLQTKDLGGFKINYDGQTFDTFQAYTEEIDRQKQEWEDYLQTQERAVGVEQNVASAFQESASAVSDYNSVVASTGESVAIASDTAQSRFGAFFTNFKDNLQQASDYAEGFALRLKNAFERKISTDRGILAFTLSLVAVFKKCMDSAKEADSVMGENMASIGESMNKVATAVGRLAEPIVAVLTPALKVLGDVLEFVTTPLRWLAEGINNVFNAIGSLFSGAEQVTKLTEEEAMAMNRIIANCQLIEENVKKVDVAYKNMTESVEQANQAMAEAWDSYAQSLKRVLTNHEDSVKKLNEQIIEANKDYKRAIEERNQAFLVSQAKEEKAHQEKVDELMAQINFLQRYNNAYNKEKLESLQFALAREQVLYRKRTEAEKAELDLQNEYEQQKRDEKLASYERELQDERDFLDKHAKAFAEVREVMLRDEVENLQKSYNAQVASATKTKNAVIAEYNNLAREMSQNNRILEIANQIYARWDSLKNTMKTLVVSYRDFAYYNEQIMRSLPDDDKIRQVAALSQSIYTTTSRLFRGYAEGGYTGRGGENEIAGVVHKGEYVLPQDMVDQTTGTPKALGNNITINVSGTFATSDSERRKVAQQILDALNQTNYARFGV